MQLLLFTDLDGTLLDHETYEWTEALPAIRVLQREEIPWMFVTSKTRAETEFWRSQMGNRYPFVVENGGAAYVPDGRGGLEVLTWGAPYESLVTALRESAAECGCAVRGFADMTALEVAEKCALPASQGELAKAREFDEPFELPDREADAPALVAAIESRGFRCTRGGRFWHVTGQNDKGLAVRALRERFEAGWGGKAVTIGLGDSWNDMPMLAAVDQPVAIQSLHTSVLQRELPGVKVSRYRGPRGWNEMVLELVDGNALAAHR